MSSDPGPRRLWLGVAVLGLMAALVAVLLVISTGDDADDDADTEADREQVLMAVEVFLQEEGIEDYDLATLDRAVDSMIDSCANDDTSAFRLTYALALDSSGGDDQLARTLVDVICPERLDELDEG